MVLRPLDHTIIFSERIYLFKKSKFDNSNGPSLKILHLKASHLRPLWTSQAVAYLPEVEVMRPHRGFCPETFGILCFFWHKLFGALYFVQFFLFFSVEIERSTYMERGWGWWWARSKGRWSRCRAAAFCIGFHLRDSFGSLAFGFPM